MILILRLFLALIILMPLSNNAIAMEEQRQGQKRVALDTATQESASKKQKIETLEKIEKKLRINSNIINQINQINDILNIKGITEERKIDSILEKISYITTDLNGGSLDLRINWQKNIERLEEIKQGKNQEQNKNDFHANINIITKSLEIKNNILKSQIEEFQKKHHLNQLYNPADAGNTQNASDNEEINLKNAEVMNIVSIQSDKNILRNIAKIIFNRETDITYIQDKICTHSPQVFEIWKDNKWQLTNLTKRRELEEELLKKYKIIKSQTKRMLQRDNFSLLNEEFITNYIKFGNQAIDEAKDENVKLYQAKGNNNWIIEIDMDFPEKEVGKIFKRSELNNPISTHTLELTIDVNEVINNITKGGKDAWDVHNDGFASTMCATIK